MQHPPKKQIKKRKGARLALILTAICLVLAAAFIALLPKIRALYPAQKLRMEAAEYPVRTLAIMDEAAVESITVSPAGSESYVLRMQDGQLYLEEKGALLNVNDVYARSVLEAVTQIVAQGVVAEDWTELEEHLPDMGLAPARASAVVRYTDGTQTTIEVGGSVPNTTYAYCRWSGSPALYMCDSGVVDALSLTARQLIPVVQPQIEAQLISSATIVNAHGEASFSFDQGVYGSLTAPFVYPLDADGASMLLTALGSFRLGTHEAAVTDENRAFYGFDQPLCEIDVQQHAGTYNATDANGGLATYLLPAQAARFVIGRAEGEYFYTCEYEGECYLVSRFLAERLIALNAESILSHTPADVGDLELKTLALSTPKGSMSVKVARTERVLPNNQLELDASGSPVYDVQVWINGSQGSQEQLNELCSRLMNMSISGRAPADFSTDGQTPRWTLTLETQNGMTRCIEAYRLDLFTDALCVDGVLLHTMDSEAVDVLAEGWIQP